MSAENQQLVPRRNSFQWGGNGNACANKNIMLYSYVVPQTSSSVPHKLIQQTLQVLASMDTGNSSLLQPPKKERIPTTQKTIERILNVALAGRRES